VSNEGTLTAKLGTVALAAGDSVTLDFAGDGLTKIKVDKAALDAVVANHGAIIADGGQAIMTVNSSLQLAQTVVNQSGVIRAQSLLERDGRIILASLGQGDVMVSGTVDASGPAAGTTGGTVHVSGDRVASSIMGRSTPAALRAAVRC
jgi:large exoprotein involved in heme utilization and adhesion